MVEDRYMLMSLFLSMSGKLEVSLWVTGAT